MTSETLRVGDRELRFETGSIARQAGGAMLVRSGDTVLLAVASADRAPSGASFVPLTTEYRLRFSAAGRVPGNYERREARPGEAETLASRLIDRSIRPLFPDAWSHETQVIVQPLSFEPQSDPGLLGIAAASAALLVSDVPWNGPVAGVRVARVREELRPFPTAADLARSDLDLVVTVSDEGVVMMEGGADELAEEVILAAIALARETARPLLDAQRRLAAKGRPKREVPAPAADRELAAGVRRVAEGPLREALGRADKRERYAACERVHQLARSELEAAVPDGAGPRYTAGAIDEQVEELKRELIRAQVLDGTRIGGRGPRDIRAISGQVGWLPRCHGSSLFTRGETQAIVTCTLGTERDAKAVEGLDGKGVERLLLHYNFPPYSVGEVKPLRGPGRREIGHGNLARRALLAVLPPDATDQYTIRLESLITESNGSSSMATVCGSTLALLDAGIQIRRPVAGVAMGLVKEGERVVVLSDILGDEDHVGDMDFKVCGTEQGITAIQLDNKLGSLPDQVMRTALEQAREGRLHILGSMAELLSAPRSDLSPHAPRVAALRIEPNRIGGLVGPGGKTIKALQAELDVEIEIAPDGQVRIYGRGAGPVRRAEGRVRDLADVPRLGRCYEGVVVSVQPFGSFVRLFEGIDGLLPEANLAINSRVWVKVLGVNNRGKLVLRPRDGAAATPAPPAIEGSPEGPEPAGPARETGPDPEPQAAPTEPPAS